MMKDQSGTAPTVSTIERADHRRQGVLGLSARVDDRMESVAAPDAPYVARNEVYKAVVDTPMVGWYALIPGEHEWILDHLWVVPSLIGHGIGRRLFLHAVARAREHGAGRLVLEADPHAVGFSERMGARVVGKTALEMETPSPLMAVELHQEGGLDLIDDSGPSFIR